MEEVLPQLPVFAAEFLDQRGEFWETTGSRKQNLFLCCEVSANFIREVLLHFTSPGIEVQRARLQRPIDPHTQRQGVLVLMGKGNQTGITLHTLLSTFAKLADMLNNEVLSW